MLEYFANITDFPDAIEEKKDFYWIRNKKNSRKPHSQLVKLQLRLLLFKKDL